MGDTVVATLRHAQSNDERLSKEKPYIITYPVASDIPRTNFLIEFFSNIKIHDMRAADLDYHECGFKMAKLDKNLPREDFDDESKIEKLYLPIVQRCLKKALGAKEVFIFDHMLRKRKPEFPFHPATKDTVPQPALSAHIDYTNAEVEERLRNYFGDQAEDFKKRHFQVVNIWKPLIGPLRDYPLAYCDAKSVNQDTDLLTVDEVFPKMVNEIYQVLYSPNHKWYWLPDQTPEEVVIFAGYDSRKGQSVAVPHCSFDLGDESRVTPAIDSGVQEERVCIEQCQVVERKVLESLLQDENDNSPRIRTEVGLPEEDLLVDWDGSQDPQNPRNWSPTRRWLVIMLISVITFNQAMSSTMFAPGAARAMADFHSSNEVVAQLLVSIYVVGLAAGPLVLSPLSELYGRIPIMHATNLAFVVGGVLCAVSVDIPMLILARLLMGISTISLGGGYVADLMAPEDRGRALNIWNIGPVLAPMVGPVVGGYITQKISWRWTFGMLSITGTFWLIICVFFLRETYAPCLLESKARKLRTSTGLQYRSKLDDGIAPKERLLASVARPWKMLSFCPVIIILSLFGSVAYCFMYLMFSTLTEVFVSTYGFTEGQAGLTFLGLGVGSLLGQLMLDFWMRGQTRDRNRTGRELLAEDHLPPLVVSGVLIACGQSGYGWSLHYVWHWIVPVAATGVTGLGIIFAFQAVQGYLVEAYTSYAASALAVSVAVRCVFGLTVPLAGPRMYEELGYGWGNTVLALIALMMVPASMLLQRFGPRIRGASQYSVR
ncbi:unnamed protein product [Zymoseptoria tritici ST99CH_1E4]|uniref:Major facilitator superfamily (MFS) profile domain-containing protein n=1 Tax=Zymoseptoria tritici ST99CH_1E4 TaxID=1276532 RepID=A0A2H1FPA7_ZYMTR|nr:unnamed protein product [Zymoseptoria tritici ST99CH_1E4]